MREGSVVDEEGGESEMTWERIVVKRNDNEEEPEREWVGERIPKMKTRERYNIKHKEGRQQRDIKVLSRVGKATSRK